MRISDWSSDVCSSDLKDGPRRFDCRAGHVGQCLSDQQAQPARIGIETIGGQTEKHRGNPLFQPCKGEVRRSEEHTSELQSLMRISYAVFCLKKKTTEHTHTTPHPHSNNN